MKKCVLGALMVGLLIAADDKKDDEKKDDAKDKLKGTWTFVAMEEGGQKAAADRIKDWSLTFEDDKVMFKRGTGTKMGRRRPEDRRPAAGGRRAPQGLRRQKHPGHHAEAREEVGPATVAYA